MTTYSKGYRGARFFKADLQMQTPGDSAHWQGRDEPDASTAKRYIERCRAEGLELIAITDHNFASPEFLAFLRDEAAKTASITLFPGFEINADVGKGVHVLAIFGPDEKNEDIDHILTLCGVPPPRFVGGSAKPSTHRLTDILEVVQSRDATSKRLRGLVILPHVKSNSGLFDKDKTSDWLQQTEFMNEDLLCIEVPKPVDQMAENWQKLLRAGPDCWPEWRRRRPIACIMSSDAKSIEPKGTNFIGSRYSWLKLSIPSIEGLRQAFLDHDSRVRLQKNSPEDDCTHPRIVSLGVSGAKFLRDLEVEFSANLNTIIGGRGTGKSTLIECLRLALADDVALSADHGQRSSELRKAIGNANISVCIEKGSVRYDIVAKCGAKPALRIGDADVPIHRMFPVQVYGQQEILGVAADDTRRLRLIDDVIKSDLDQLQNDISDLVSEWLEISRATEDLSDLRRRLDLVRADIETLSSGLASFAREQPIRRAYGDLLSDIRTVGSAHDLARTQLENWVEVVSRRRHAPPIAEDAREHVRDLTTKIEEVVAKVAAEIEASINRGKAHLETIQQSEPMRQLRDRFDDARRRLEESTVTPIDANEFSKSLAQYEESLADAQSRRNDLEARIVTQTEKIGRRNEVRDRIRSLWRRQTQCRLNVIENIHSRVPRTAGGKPFVCLELKFMGDRDSFLFRLRQLSRDRRRLSDDDVDELGIAVFEQAMAADESPALMLSSWIEQLRAGECPAGFPWPSNDRRVSVVLDVLHGSQADEIAVWRNPDLLTVSLYREDGSLVGDIAKEASIGQRCTAVLAILMASSDAPLVIDQPEDDLDNSFVFHHLVPMFREIKEHRQIIVATHNANIPVNADAELVCALATDNGRGGWMKVDGDEAVGAMDRPAVKRAVEDVMEGSEKAFMQRFEKYGF